MHGNTVSLNYRIAWWIFTKRGREKVILTPHICIDFWVKSVKAWIQGRAILGQWGAILQRTSSELEGYSNKPKCIAMIKSMWEDVFGSILMSSFWYVLVSCIGLSHFHFLFSFKYFNGAKCLIYINLCTFHVKKILQDCNYTCARYKTPRPLVFIVLWQTASVGTRVDSVFQNNMITKIEQESRIGIFEFPKYDSNPDTRGIGPLVGRTNCNHRSVMHVLAVISSLTKSCHFWPGFAKGNAWPMQSHCSKQKAVRKRKCGRTTANGFQNIVPEHTLFLDIYCLFLSNLLLLW